MSVQNVRTASFAQAQSVLRACIKARTSLLLIGPPGVGKTSLVEGVFAALGQPVGTLIGSTVAETDVGGFPVVERQPDGTSVLRRVPLQIIEDAARGCAGVFLDEITSCSPATLAALLRGILDRTFGDRKLHADSTVHAACNEPEQTPGGGELPASVIARLCVVKLVPTLDEVCGYFSRLDAPVTGQVASTLHVEAVALAACFKTDPRLLQMEPPEASVRGMRPWANPRQYERMLRTVVADDSGDLMVRSIIEAGHIGEEVAVALGAIQKLFGDMPNLDEIAASPATARVPDSKATQIAAIGLLNELARKSIRAAWIYTDRLTNRECRAAITQLLLGRPDTGPAHLAEASERAKSSQMADYTRALRGAAPKVKATQ